MFNDIITTYTDIYWWKSERSFCKSFSHFFNKKFWDINIQNFNDTLTNDVVSFEQLGPGCSKKIKKDLMMTLQWQASWKYPRLQLIKYYLFLSTDFFFFFHKNRNP